MSDPRQPYPFQERVTELVLSGHSVILQAPTGAGKTYAALRPFLSALGNKHDFPSKCIYAVPMRVLANQFYETYEEEFRQAGCNGPSGASILTGERRDDIQFRARVTFATIDQVLSSFLMSPYSLSRGQANINAGAVVSSYLVFDEFHLFDPDSTLPTTLEALRMLSGVTPFLLMTATFSQTMLNQLAEKLGAVVVPESDDAQREIQAISSQQKVRRYHVAEGPLSAEAVLGRHKGRSLVICNVVERARALYRALREQAGPDTEVVLLHSRFLKEDRNRLEETIRKRFAKDAKGTNLIVVATQVVEVGLDISSDALHTELAPANAVLQRAGRCARYKGEIGDVYIYAQTYSDGEVVDLCDPKAVMPYQGQGEEFRCTLQAFRDRNGDELDFVAEQEIISEVHGPRDAAILDGIESARSEHIHAIFAAMRGEAGAGSLVHKVASQTVVIHTDPDRLLDAPFSVEGFSLHPGTVQGYIKKWLERAYEMDEDLPFAVKSLCDRAEAEDKYHPAYHWQDVREPQDAWGAPIVVVHPALAGYAPDEGFLPDRGNSYQTREPDERARQEERERYTYRLETYAEHVRLVYEAFREVWPEMDRTARKLEERFGWPAGSVERAAALAVLLHDVGKLNREWQAWGYRWQAKIDAPVTLGACYAHWDNDGSDEHAELAKSIRLKRPPHATESAVAAAQAVAQDLSQLAGQRADDLIMAALSAMARHHSAFTQGFQAYRLVESAAEVIQRSLPDDFGMSEIDLIAEADPNSFPIDGVLLGPTEKQHKALLVYMLIARALRLADHEGTARGSR